LVLIAILVLTFALITQNGCGASCLNPLLMIQFRGASSPYSILCQLAIAWLCYKFEFKKAVPYAAVTALGFCLVALKPCRKAPQYAAGSEPESSMVVYHGEKTISRRHLQSAGIRIHPSGLFPKRLCFRI
jgi:hypothetical protein